MPFGERSQRSFARIAIFAVTSIAAFGVFGGISTGCSELPDITFGDSEAGLVPAVCGGPEICDDGIDNDCNGQTDCADPACNAGYACFDRAPSEWELVAFASASRAACPAGYGAATDAKAVEGLESSCNCACSGPQVCNAGALTVSLGDNGACGGPSFPATISNDCQKLPGNGFTVANDTFARATAPAGGGACMPTAQPPVNPVTDGRTCAAPPRFGKGCGPNQVCAPKATAGYEICFARRGDHNCPNGFEKGRRIGRSANDSRSCSACNCTTSPCFGEVRFFGSPTCNGPDGLSVSANGACNQENNGDFTARAYRATVNGGCGVANPPPTMNGRLSFEDETTICCD